MVVRLNKKKIFLLYQYYLLGELNQEEIEEELINWFAECLTKESLLRERIAKKLNLNWEFSRLLPLEKAILIYGAYELEQKPNHANLIINNIVNFSKAYLEKEKIGYINKVLDLLAREK